jgi:Trypsin-like peptidase domain
MPILIRIILQRLLILSFSLLAFFGINPDISVPTDQVVQQREQVQQERVQEILQVKPEQSVVENSATSSTPVPIPNKAVVKVENKITQIQQNFTNTITQVVVDKAQEIVPTDFLYTNENKPFNIADVVVNILCLERTKTYTRLTSGSGVIISPSGLILTNAHVTYPFLHTPQFNSSLYSCSVRQANIPNFGYNAELVYYPADWLSYNSEVIKTPNPTGTGENDYAFLQITSALGPTPKQNQFPFASTQVDINDLKEGADITASGYPSSNSGVFEIDTKPGLKIAESTIADFFTFGSRTHDILQTGVNEVAHRGSSGGGIFNKNILYGIVVTTNTNSQGSYINALTIPYIKRDFKNDTGFDFDTFTNSTRDVLKLRFDTLYKPKIEQLIASEN